MKCRFRLIYVVFPDCIADFLKRLFSMYCRVPAQKILYLSLYRRIRGHELSTSSAGLAHDVSERTRMTPPPSVRGNVPNLDPLRHRPCLYERLWSCQLATRRNNTSSPCGTARPIVPPNVPGWDGLDDMMFLERDLFVDVLGGERLDELIPMPSSIRGIRGPRASCGGLRSFSSSFVSFGLACGN